ncbi:MAG: hypothetical protein WDZ93_02185 [Candidatus Paceibacterota bacterium]
MFLISFLADTLIVAGLCLGSWAVLREKPLATLANICAVTALLLTLVLLVGAGSSSMVNDPLLAFATLLIAVCLYLFSLIVMINTKDSLRKRVLQLEAEVDKLTPKAQKPKEIPLGTNGHRYLDH